MLRTHKRNNVTKGSWQVSWNKYSCKALFEITKTQICRTLKISALRILI